MQGNGLATIAMGSKFDFVISGSASGPENRVLAWEKFDKVNGCAPTFADESVRAIFQPANVYGLTESTSQVVKGTYSVPAAFGAKNAGEHGMCTYLNNYTNGLTYAHAGEFWSNVSPWC